MHMHIVDFKPEGTIEKKFGNGSPDLLNEWDNDFLFCRSPSPIPFPKFGEGESEAPSPDLERGVGVRILDLAVNDYEI